jgi:hypothetical protein
MYSQWGDVDYPFQLQPYDIFVAYDISGSYYEYRILSIDTSQSPNIYVNLDNSVPTSLRANLNANSSKFLFLKRIEDETNLHLNFTKRRGSTSYGFLIPENLAPDVLANIDTITKQVKQKLLADQQGTTL